MVQVAAALIVSGNKFFICQRPENKARGLLWEFPGGKLEPGETPEQALIRECHEELDADVIPDCIYTKLVHEYPDITIELIILKAHFAQGDIPKLIEHKAFAYITPEESLNYCFCPADYPVLDILYNDKSLFLGDAK